MIPLLLGVATGAFIIHHHHVKKATANPTHTVAPPGVLTPGRAAIHGHFMTRVHQPHRLMKAAHLFGAEGLTQQAAELAAKAQAVQQQAKGAAELVERSRAGDQNAMGTIADLRDVAIKGGLRAKVSCILIEEYCKANPPREHPPSAVAAMAAQAQQVPIDAAVAHA